MVSLVFFCTAIAYLLGSISTAVIVSKIMGKGDIRKAGSGNAGTTNTLRVLGKKAAIFVALGDFLKGVLAVLIAKLLFDFFKVEGDKLTVCCFASLAVVLGHIYPIYFGFKGGKGIMTSFATVVMLDWEIAVILIVLFIIIVASTKYVSLGSCAAGVMYPVLVTMFHQDKPFFVAVSLILCALVLYCHRANIKRLVQGTESKIKF